MEWIVALVGIVLVTILFLMYFNRDPERKIPKGDVIVAPADGKLMSIKKRPSTYELAIFMSPKEVHVQRVPYSGTVTALRKIDGPNLPAFLERSKHNKKVITTFKTKLGTIVVKQMTGLAVRRIIPYLKKGDQVEVGARLGRVTFGSRVDLTIPSKHLNLKVKEGQRVYAGETIIAIVNR